jgi:hypothetical protein
MSPIINPNAIQYPLLFLFFSCIIVCMQVVYYCLCAAEFLHTVKNVGVAGGKMMSSVMVYVSVADECCFVCSSRCFRLQWVSAVRLWCVLAVVD